MSKLFSCSCKFMVFRRLCYSTSSSDRKKYDVIVIGGGSGGLACAKEASSFGKKVAVLDYVNPSTRGTVWGLGGTCVNVGCIPKKLFHYASCLGEALHDSRSYGWEFQENLSHNWSTLQNAINLHIKSLNWGHRVQLKQKNVDFYNAYGSFIDQHTIKLATPKQEEKQEISGDNIVIAVGGRPKYPDDVPGALEYGISSDDIFYLKKPPGKTLVIGGSYVALECAGFLTGLGFDTTVMVRSICLRGFDQQMAELVSLHMASTGTKFLYRTEPLQIRKNDSGKLIVMFKDEHKNEKQDIFDTVMFAIGRQAQTKALGLQNIGVEVHRESLKVIGKDDEQSSIPHIYAIGDVLHGKPELTPVAIKAGKFLAHRLFGDKKYKMDYENVATTVFTPLEYGCVGLAEETGIKRFGEDDLEIFHAFYKPLEYYISQRSSEQCYVKVICMKKSPQNVVGMHFLGPHAGEVIQGFSTAIRCGMTMEDLSCTVGIHPTVAEEVVKLYITKRSGMDPTVTGC